MSAGNSTEEPVKLISDAAEKATETAKSDQSEKTYTPMPFKERLCLNVSIMAIVLAILHVTGLINGLPTFLSLAVKEQPFTTFGVTLLASGLLTFVLSDLMPRQIDVVGRLPVFVFSAFWLNFAWTRLIEGYGSTLKDASPAWVLIATMILGFCVSYHENGNEKRRSTVSERIELFVWTTIGANIVAFLATLLITAVFIGDVKGSIESKIDSEVELHQRLDYIVGACPEVKSKEYCNALKVVTSRQ
ncbi:hypothetical protein [Rhizobium sp. MHM7A]|uniref:hypothetical protein n=1 Tax=Rhizobium sp. MHM7A TaxID=2583233 RepID=UPI001105B66A|nr:hypothetical protein [Rhizobium sp. MHM7A]TLX17130.1 hypothetical protein FFR93_07410 [Rhizobium sp. MHM7A]